MNYEFREFREFGYWIFAISPFPIPHYPAFNDLLFQRYYASTALFFNVLRLFVHLPLLPSPDGADVEDRAEIIFSQGSEVAVVKPDVLRAAGESGVGGRGDVFIGSGVREDGTVDLRSGG